MPKAWTAPAASALRAVAETRLAVTALLDYMPLPAPTMSARADAVYVNVADPDDLLPWLAALDGTIHRSPAFEGVQLWTLHTFTPPGRTGDRVPVRVSVPVPCGEPVMHELLSAVAA
ncbi:hypothetical protein FF041_28110 [Streptomyces jumonjinensis]|uniref:Uncharacterized protein n=1 Tax=Streptomyces jumonjinensis TaxID=1945 RepID=A0A646KNS3_STRJU|nr:hypothetical protein [Streptomyces jumonjinensis]